MPTCRVNGQNSSQIKKKLCISEKKLFLSIKRLLVKGPTDSIGLVFYSHVPPVLARPDAIELSMGDPKLLGYHLEAALVAFEHLLDHNHLSFVELIIFGLSGGATVFQVGIFTVVIVHFLPSYPAKVLKMVVVLIVIEVDYKFVFWGCRSQKVRGYEFVNVAIDRLAVS